MKNVKRIYDSPDEFIQYINDVSVTVIEVNNSNSQQKNIKQISHFHSKRINSSDYQIKPSFKHLFMEIIAETLFIIIKLQTYRMYFFTTRYFNKIMKLYH